MATKQTTVSAHKEKPKVKRKGIVAKTKSSATKSSKLYRKLYRGQGK